VLRSTRPLTVAFGLFAVFVVLAVASCHGGYHPLEAAAACRCTPSQYCHVRATGTAECLPFPATCADPPACACLGRRVDACREELGAFTILEPRAVSACDDCSSEEYCYGGGGAETRMCRLIPARCEDTPTCECLMQAHGVASCNERHGRIEVGALGMK
jgi:hypothetical protein